MRCYDEGALRAYLDERPPSRGAQRLSARICPAAPPAGRS